MIQEITQYIEDNTDYTIGTNLFSGHKPQSAPMECITILENAGGKPDFYLTDYVEKLIQVLVRAKTFFIARNNAYEIYKLLHGQAGITLPTITSGEVYYVNTIEALNVPQPVGQDEAGNWEFSTNFIFRIQNK